jgi:mannitol-1-phosphate 5-dehydrogenase
VSAPRCLIAGAGRVAGGFVAPLLSAAGWETLLICRNREVRDAINAGGGLWLRVTGAPERWVGRVRAISPEDPELLAAAAGADLFATSVGPSSLAAAGRMLAPLLGERLEESSAPVNVITFENHRRAPELLTLGLLEAHPQLAGEIGVRLGIGGAAVWRAVSRRAVAEDGIRFEADAVEECYVDAASLVPGVPPLDGSIPGLSPVRAFDDRIIEKLWIFNAGHAAAAYLGWHAGCRTLHEAMSRPGIRAAVSEIVAEARRAFEAYLEIYCRPVPVPSRPPGWILDRYTDPALADPVVRVAREPRRKLAADDRLIGPAIACRAAGIEPSALATAAAAALSYADPSDPQAVNLQRELELLGPAEVLSTVSTLAPQDELARLICRSYHERAAEEAAL